MGESIEEFDSLFDYHRVQPFQVVCLDDDDRDSSPPKRKKSDKEGKAQKVPAVVNLDDDQEEEEDWLPPPPKIFSNATKKLVEDSTLKELRAWIGAQLMDGQMKLAENIRMAGKDDRLMKQELLSITQSLEGDDELAAEKPCSSSESKSQSAPEAAPVQPSVPCERVKIVLSVQDRDGAKQFRVYVDEKFERVFKLYADKQKLKVESLVFSFDGGKIDPTATPVSLEMEDNDMIEVRTKPS